MITVSERGTVELAGKAIGTRGAIRQISKTVRAEDIDEDLPFYYIYSATDEKCRELASAIHGERAGKLLRSAENICPVIGAHIGLRPRAYASCERRRAERCAYLPFSRR